MNLDHCFNCWILLLNTYFSTFKNKLRFISLFVVPIIQTLTITRSTSSFFFFFDLCMRAAPVMACQITIERQILSVIASVVCISSKQMHPLSARFIFYTNIIHSNSSEKKKRYVNTTTRKFWNETITECNRNRIVRFSSHSHIFESIFTRLKQQ